MKRTHLIFSAAAIASLTFLMPGCGRQTRGSDDAYDRSRAEPPPAGDATQSENVGNTVEKTRADGVSPSASQSGRSQDVSADSPPAPSTPPIKQPSADNPQP